MRHLVVKSQQSIKCNHNKKKTYTKLSVRPPTKEDRGSNHPLLTGLTRREPLFEIVKPRQ
jgi:hypothetical protein